MATRPLPEAAESRFASYIEELHEFLATSGVRFGAPEDLPGVMDRLRVPGTFHDDLSSLVRSFVLRQGGAMPHAQLMEILALAIAGPEMAREPQQYREPLRELLGFVAGVMRRPWNALPGDGYEAEVVPFPSEGTGRAEKLGSRPEVAAAIEPEAEVAAGPEAAKPEIEFQPAILRPMPIPIHVRERVMEAPVPPVVEAAIPPLVPDDPLPPQTPSDPIPAPEPSPAPNLAASAGASAEAEAVAPMSAISAALAAESERVGHVQEAVQPVAQVAEAEPKLNTMLRPISTAAAHPNEDVADEEPRRSAVPREVLIAGIGGLVLAAVLMFTFRARPSGEVYTVQPAGSSATTRPAGGQTPSQPATSTAGPAASPYTSGTANPAKPSAYGPQLAARALRHARQLAAAAAGEDVAQPYFSSPQFAKGASAGAVTGTAHAVPIQPQQRQSTAATTYSPYNGGASETNPGVPTQAPAPIVREPAARKPRDPDATIVGDSPAGTHFLSNATERASSFTVSSGVMAANLISSPEPEYPAIARIAHIQGQVILQAVIAKDGSVSNTRVLRGNRLLRGAAEEAVRRWRYRPYRVSGRAVNVATIITVDFHRGG